MLTMRSASSSSAQLEILVAGVEGLEVVGAVVGGGAVHVGAVIGELLLDVLAGLGLHEEHVLEQVRHAGFAVAFVARADQVGHVDGDFGLGGVGEKQHVEAVGKGVFGDAFDGGDLLDALREGLGERGEGENQEKRAATPCYDSLRYLYGTYRLSGLDELYQETFGADCGLRFAGVYRRGHTYAVRWGERGRCGGRGLRVFAGRVPAASDLVGIYKDVGAVLMTLSTSSVPSFRFSTSVSSGSAINAIRTSTGVYPFERKIFPPVSST